MTRFLSILTLTGILLGISGCTEWLDLRPENETVLDDYWQDESQVNQVLATCYRAMTEGDYIDRMMVWGELRSDNVTFGDDMAEAMNQILSVDISPSNTYCHWGPFYRVINYCNNFLHYAPEVTEIDPNFTVSDLRKLEAEVLTIRALTYFYLVRTFKEVPWIEEPSIDDLQDYNIKKSSEDFVLNKIVKDLNTALIYARDKFDDEVYNKGRITRNAVRAILADVYLWRGDYMNCINMCDEILDDKIQKLKLIDGENVINQVFYRGNSSESIFELQFDDDQIKNDAVYNLYGGYGNIFGEWSFPGILIWGKEKLFNYADEGGESEKDIRRKEFLFQYIDKFYIFKYSGARRIVYENYSSYYYRSNTSNWIVYRLSSIILMKAEALIQSDELSEALKMINITYLRSNPELENDSLKLSNYSSKPEMEKLLLRERQRELMFEGSRWFDLMRLARRANSPAPLVTYVSKKFSSNVGSQTKKMSVMNALYLPIHTDELKANSALTQNEFYEVESD